MKRSARYCLSICLQKLGRISNFIQNSRSADQDSNPEPSEWKVKALTAEPRTSFRHKFNVFLGAVWQADRRLMLFRKTNFHFYRTANKTMNVVTLLFFRTLLIVGKNPLNWNKRRVIQTKNCSRQFCLKNEPICFRRICERTENEIFLRHLITTV